MTHGSWRPYELEEDEEISINVTDDVAFGDFNDVISKLHFKESKTSDKSFGFPLNTVRKFVPQSAKSNIKRFGRLLSALVCENLPKHDIILSLAQMKAWDILPKDWP